MLKINQGLTVRDMAGNRYQTDRVLCDLGRCATIYAVRGQPTLQVVHFHDKPIPQRFELQKMTSCATPELAKENILWPMQVCMSLDDDTFCGFIAHGIDLSRPFITLNQLQHAPFEDVPLQLRLETGLALARCIQTVHQTQKQYILGSMSPEDFWVNTNGDILYPFAFRCGSNSPTITDRYYVAPEMLPIRKTLLSASRESDCFIYSLILFELLTGTRPFSGSSPEELDEQMANGESIFYYEDAPQCIQMKKALQAISPQLCALFLRTFDYCGAKNYVSDRPGMAEWIDELSILCKRTIANPLQL